MPILVCVHRACGIWTLASASVLSLLLVALLRSLLFHNLLFLSDLFLLLGGHVGGWLRINGTSCDAVKIVARIPICYKRSFGKSAGLLLGMFFP